MSQNSNNKQARWWWVMKWFDTRALALAWEPPQKPKIKYCCWRVHECPTTQKIHAHILFNFTSGVRFSTLEKKDYHNIKWVKQEDLAKKRGYCISDYHKKDGTPKGVISAFMEVGEWAERLDKRKNDEIYKQAFLTDTSIKEGLSIIKENCPRDFAIHGESIERNLRRTKPFTVKSDYELTSFNMGEIDFDDKSVLLWGPTNTGKTSFALAHFNNPYFISGSIDRLKSYDNEVYDGIVFDECSTKHWPPESVIHLVDWQYPRDIKTRYSDAHIPAKTRKIFCHNTENPFYEITIPDDIKDAIERRLKRVHVTGNLY